MQTIVAPIGDVAPVNDAALPIEWAQWAEEPGKVVQLEQDGALVGRIHAVVVGQSEAWIEGAWVAPASRRTGVGRRLVAAAEELVKGYGAAIVRTAAPAHNAGALALAARTGFVECARAGVYVLGMPRDDATGGEGAASAADHGVRRASAVEAPTVASVLSASPALKPWGGLVPIGWRFRRLSLDLVRGLAKDGRVLVTTEGGGAALMTAGGSAAIIAALTGTPVRQADLVRAAAAEVDAERVVVFAPGDAGLAEHGGRRAPHAWCPQGLVILEKIPTR